MRAARSVLATGYILTPAEKVDTGGVVRADGITSVNRGDARYLGTEVNRGFTWRRFAPDTRC